MSFTIYPAIDLRGGKVVRLKEGDPARMTSYSDDPAETARKWLGMGAQWLHVVNLDGAFGEGDNANRAALESILKLGARVQFGGGIRSMESIADVLKLGVSRAILGTIAIEQPAIVADALTRFGAEQIAVGIDARDGLVRTRGWKDNSGVSAIDLALQMRTVGLGTVIFTDVSRDGLGSGLNIPSTRELAERSGLDVIASGGVHTIDDVIAAKDAGLAGCIIGRALYDGTVDLKEALQV
ncbi:1-(5-phosphoribosyl)-5-[(5-phosphoribosylamino)methylideneamino]imidazole-4-carboxamide isomerase [Candidatus Villigracilis affinis]|uniref:1-(5-phosphoribosyl)-5-[(5- phosphoribosylamino)methylideneamino]imidazole-4- carboxamide isomerase n=1 Tax=Candidatus Villigracilis affinis TaxID=3140682 RepID=UPI001D77A610|nr:1-(5-phosphoribosyl)-5-[(5-phosphoribosylamino)methylideneamino]imidazole-4-carboxamide isomerase [Anaerolineales bacterium]